MRKVSPKVMERLRAIGRRRTKTDFEWISSGSAENELANAFSLPSDAASILLRGLIAWKWRPKVLSPSKNIYPKQVPLHPFHSLHY